ncbi:DUF4157 domain-containing protein [Flavivirga abyssicola]|uniref:eCIS core domain-containing protein n=1 Tax=Flavivirga abyssicola TaxID=3063533 RepID=UPI0026DEFB89|nr:DUF4157 domain-containing protein [Flavivirga sp. MEBiC07777]WVK13364.1 DUF4157 domain-containing protein [Flavivirga sp. MEBiC07777]
MNKKPLSSNGQSETRCSDESTMQFADNRTEGVGQIKLQELANNSPQATQLKAFQELANNTHKAKQLIQLQENTDNNSSEHAKPIQKKDNKTGLPNNLKTGMENLSGMSLDDVKVHRNSDKPAQLQAHAYAQGTDIHLGPGQEKHLPHEAWHVVQQKQGRVRPTIQMKGKISINNDTSLEREADIMGAKAMNTIAITPIHLEAEALVSETSTPFQHSNQEGVIQGQFVLVDPENSHIYAWEDQVDLDAPSTGAYVYCGVWVGGGDKALFTDQSNVEDGVDPDEWVFYDSQRREYDYRDFRSRDFFSWERELRVLVDGAHSRSRKYEPEGDIGNLDFRYVRSGGHFYSTTESLCDKVELNYDGVDVRHVSEVKLIFWQSIYLGLSALGKFPYEDERIGRNYLYVPGEYWEPKSNTSHNTEVGGVLGPANKPPQHAEYNKKARRAARGNQKTTMAGWNALGYAINQNVENTEHPSTDWEWLHIRGSRIGGPDRRTNFVAGTHAANSEMIPWERKILELSKRSDDHHPLIVDWSATTKGDSHIGDKIAITARIPYGFGDGEPDPPVIETKVFDATLAAKFTRLDRDLSNAIAFARSPAVFRKEHED